MLHFKAKMHQIRH